MLWLVFASVLNASVPKSSSPHVTKYVYLTRNTNVDRDTDIPEEKHFDLVISMMTLGLQAQKNP